MMMNTIPIDREHRPCLDEQGRARGGDEPWERALPWKDFAMPPTRIAMHLIEEVLRMRHECGRSQREVTRAGCRRARSTSCCNNARLLQ